MIASSTDGATTFISPLPIATKTELSGGNCRGFVLPPTLFRAWPTMFPVVRTHPTKPDVVYVVFGADPNPFPDDGFATNDDSDIFFSRSVNGGTTFISPIRVNNDTGINDQFFAWMTVQPSGDIQVTFGDRREDPADTFYNVFRAVSTDGGLSFKPNDKVTAGPSNPNTEFLGFFIGDYFGNTSSSGQVFAAWTDTRFEQDQNIFVGTAPGRR